MDYVIVDYIDVWGSDEEWIINNKTTRYDFGIITLTDDMSDEDIFNHLKKIGFIEEAVDFDDIYMEGGDDTIIEFGIKENYYPCFRLEKIN